MNDCKPVGTPMETCCKLQQEVNQPDVDHTMYRSMIGSLLYLTATRPDIMHSVCLVSRFQSTPKISHLNAVKRIMKYISGTLDFGLWYPRHNDFTLTTYIDADWAGCPDDRKSTSGGALFLGGRLVAWHSKKQNSVSLYIAATTSCTQVLWMIQTLQVVYLDVLKPVSIFCDNSSAIDISKNPVQHSRTKHIDIQYHFLRERVFANDVTLQYVSSTNQVVDIFTKDLPKATFEFLRGKLGIFPLSFLQ